MTTLDSSPSILPMYVKSALPMLPGASSLPFVPGGGSEIPADLGFELEDVRPDPGRVAEYARVCGFALKDALPPTYPHMLAFPLHMAIMSDGSFPFGAVGLVHIENSITHHRPIGFGEELNIKVSVSPLQGHPKGQVFSLLTDVETGGETIWSETSTMLRRSKASGAEAGLPLVIPSLDPETPPSSTWKLAGDLGRRYGAVSGDRNPIHMHSLSAKPLGFPAAIAHGMWTKARALAQLDNRLPDAFTADVRFRKPIFLPGKVDFASAQFEGQTLFTVRDSRKSTLHLEGRLGDPAPSTEKDEN